MRRIDTGTRPVPHERGCVYATVTVDPAPEQTPEEFMRQLNASGVLEDALIATELRGAYVLVTLVGFSLTKWMLEQEGELLAFAALLPDED